MQVREAMCEKVVRERHLQLLGKDDVVVYWADREISRQEAEWVVAGAQNQYHARVLDQGGFETGNDWYLCQQDGTGLIVLMAIIA
jgi:hypothetical protein